MLLALVTVPLLLALYVAASRRQRRAADAFTTRKLARSVAPHRPGFRKHVPVLVALLALTALLTAVARPHRKHQVPVRDAQIMLVTDTSGSMLAKDVAPDRLTAAQQAARRFIARVPKDVRVGIMAFNERPMLLASPTTERETLESAIGLYKAAGGTATGFALQQSLAALGRPTTAATANQPPTKKPAPAAIVLLSDGASTKGVDPMEMAQLAGKLKVPISTVALGTPQGTITVRKRGSTQTEVKRVPPDPESLKRLADASGGRAYDAGTASDLSEVYKQLGTKLTHRNVKEDITAYFAAAAAALVVAAAALSLLWFGRLA